MKADYDKLLEEYKKAKAAYDTAKAKYDAEFATYERELQNAEAKKNEEGYLSKVESQPFVFKSEPQAVLTLDPSIRTYTNHFSLLINNQYQIESNQVSVSTPPAEITVQTAQKFEPISNRTWQHPRSASKQAGNLQLSVNYQTKERTSKGQLPKIGSNTNALLTYLGLAALLAAAGIRSSKKES